MAHTLPENIEALKNATPGERADFRFLREAARPDSDFIGWYDRLFLAMPRGKPLLLLSGSSGLMTLLPGQH